MLSDKNAYLFEENNVFLSFLRLSVPTMIGQIILVIYNMADTFFIGMTGSDFKLTAVTVCMPAFMFLSAISNLFGVGGSSVIARALGAGRQDEAEAASGFAFWGCVSMTLGYSLLTALFIHPFIDLLGGGNSVVHADAQAYLIVTVVIGGFFTALNTLLAHLIRGLGSSIHASIGIALGGILNIALDPLFMFRILPTGREVLGAGVATALSNVAACAYFAAVIMIKRRDLSVLQFRFRAGLFEGEMPKAILINGLPAALMTFFENVSYAVLDRLMYSAGMACQAGIGVAKKINMLAHCMVRGTAQGALPLIAYNYGSKNYKRMRGAVMSSIATSVALSTACMAAYLIFSEPLVGLFIVGRSHSAVYAASFLRILCLGCPFSGAAYAVISFYQALGQSRRSFILATLRKGLIDIPAMFILGALIPVYGIVWATPLADVLCCAAAVYLFLGTLRSLK